jgi:broad specificity phosphatase PhoE
MPLSVPDLPEDLTIYFVRHGQTDWNKAQRYQGQTDITLNDTGRTQAARNGRLLRETLNQKLVVDFVASPLLRTVETMAIVRREMALTPLSTMTDDRLKEQHFGHWEGQLWADLPTLDPEGFAARQADPWSWTPRGGENYKMLTDRIRQWLMTLHRTTVVVSHGNVSRSLRGLMLGLEASEIPSLECPQDKILLLRVRHSEWI